MSRLLLVEGIPGAGKSTTARRLGELLTARGQRCSVFLEGDRQPADLAWQWWLTADEFAELLRRWPQAADTLQASAWQGRAGVSVAYDRLDQAAFGPGWTELERRMDDREPFGGVVAPELFVDLLAARWDEVGQEEAGRRGFVVFEAALLQDTLVELVLFAEWDEESVASAVERLVAGVLALDPVVLRLVSQDPVATITRAGAERVDEHGLPWWLHGLRVFMSGTPWARSRGLSEEAALHAYLEQRLAIEDRLRARLPLTWWDVHTPSGGSGTWEGLDAALAAVADRLVAEAPEDDHPLSPLPKSGRSGVARVG